MPADTDPLIKKKDGQSGVIRPSSTGCIKIVFALLAEVIAFYI